MEQLLRPDRFNADPNAASARDEWTYWHQTFVNYFEEIPENKRPDQLKTLINFLSASVNKTIAHCTTYEKTILVLKNQFEKPAGSVHPVKEASGEIGRPAACEGYFSIVFRNH